jgi:hypothetical protein
MSLGSGGPSPQDTAEGVDVVVVRALPTDILVLVPRYGNVYEYAPPRAQKLARRRGRELNELLAPGSGRQAGMRAASTGDSCC